MLLIEDLEIFNEAQPDDPVALICQNCRQIFYKPKKEILAVLNGSNKRSTLEYCSCDCQRKACLRAHTTRSIAECQAEKYLSHVYPEEWIEFNDRNVLGMELDIVFVNRKLAVELNGGVHYRSIGADGDEKLRKQQERDEEKRRLCEEAGYSLIVVDTRPLDHYNPKKAETVFGRMSDTIDEELKRSEEKSNYEKSPRYYYLTNHFGNADKS